jgi:hypothetical protein
LDRKIFTFYINNVLLFKGQLPGPKDERLVVKHELGNLVRERAWSVLAEIVWFRTSSSQAGF